MNEFDFVRVRVHEYKVELLGQQEYSLLMIARNDFAINLNHLFAN